MIGGQFPIVTLGRSRIPLAIFRFTLGQRSSLSGKGLNLATAPERARSLPGRFLEKKNPSTRGAA